MGRILKYDENTFPLLAEKNARDGLNDKENAKNLGISEAVFYRYQNEYPEFKDAIQRGKKPVTIQVENALIKKALGYEYIEETIEYYPPKSPDEDKSKLKVKSVKRTKKYYPSDTASIFGYLYNKAPEEYKRNRIDIPIPIKPQHLPNIKKLKDADIIKLWEEKFGNK